MEVVLLLFLLVLVQGGTGSQTPEGAFGNSSRKGQLAKEHQVGGGSNGKFLPIGFVVVHPLMANMWLCFLKRVLSLTKASKGALAAEESSVAMADTTVNAGASALLKGRSTW
ncbi:hypothetical protein BT96DRAFT_947033 [Gymnopus androsaceus JB14]|uniref:Secreted protein n=1 Tax=Gymnopus androsaceus JB14 TaxID=1447944 RepID=A0A6A4GV32_9AGAR|nr:hypothetical protein BT96DRAFT_947033 [Gymnopus androsaceus JB14]